MEYYGLLGLPMFTSDHREIKAAFRRVVKLVHPDILGAESSALQQLVTDAYETLSKDDTRSEYDEMLYAAKPNLAQSMWDPEAPPNLKGIFVDETICEGCGRCTDVASSTFKLHDLQDSPEREGKSHVVLQYGDAQEMIKMAIVGCPTRAIKPVSREELPLWEYAMSRCVKARKRLEEGAEAPTPFDLIQEYKLNELIAMDMDEALRQFADPLADERIAGELSVKAKAIHSAASAVPPETREILWPQTGAQESAAARVAARERKVQPGQSGRSTKGLERAELKAAVFQMFDKDRDGFLWQTELYEFASRYGFEGDEAEWAEEYELLSGDLGFVAANGVDVRTFSKMLEDALYLSDADLAKLLNEWKGMPRAGQ